MFDWLKKGGGIPLKQVIVVRRDLKLGKGKLAAQVAHAALAAADVSPLKREWVAQGQKKSVVRVETLDDLIALQRRAQSQGLPTALITDAGHTQIPAGTVTCLGLGPAPERELDHLTGELKLL